jgi:hypothetical protein
MVTRREEFVQIRIAVKSLKISPPQNGNHLSKQSVVSTQKLGVFLPYLVTQIVFPNALNYNAFGYNA